MAQGYPEFKDPFTGKAPKHQAAANKSKGRDISNAEIVPIKEKDVSEFDDEFIKERFLFHAHRIWGDIIDQISFKFVKREQKKDHTMSLAYSSRPKAFSNTLYIAPKNMTLYHSDAIFEYSKEDAEKIIIHEAIHIGYPDHNKEFLHQVVKFGGVKTISHLEGLGIQMQSKKRENKRERYKTIRTFKDDEMDIARIEADKYVREHRDERVRLQF